MRLLSKEVFIKCQNGRPVFPGFVSYISASEPLLMHRSGWVDDSDTYDDFADRFSSDNGVTWSEPQMKQQSYKVPGGLMRYAENACFFDKDTGKLLTFCSRAIYPDQPDTDLIFELTADAYDPVSKKWQGETVMPLSLPGGVAISFCFPIKTATGKLLVPAMTMPLDDSGKAIHYLGCWAPMYVSLTMQGEYQADGSLNFKLGQPVRMDPEKSSRGYDENTLAQLNDGRIMMIMRADNTMYPERPGTKWHAFSEDEGMSWSEPERLLCSDGSLIESGSNGSALFRSIKTGKLYWIGNLAIDGDRANGNWPRSPLTIAEMQEEPFGIKRETITVIDRRGPNEPSQTQMSNFRFYQDCETGDVVLFLSRFGENDNENWKQADYYKYRIEID